MGTCPHCGAPMGKRVEMPDLPQELDTEAFRSAWADWLVYRRERHLALPKEKSVKTLFKRLAKHGSTAACAAIENSIANNWQGLFPEKTNGRHDKPKHSAVEYESDRELEPPAL